MRVGVLGVGVCLPPDRRTNDYWSQETIATWPRAALPSDGSAATTPLARRALEALLAQRSDPFQGTVARRILSLDLGPSDVEEEAVRAALARAAVLPSEIDLLLVDSPTSDKLLGNPACSLHHRLGLPAHCLSIPVGGSAYSFLHQLRIAEAMIRSTAATTALLVQSSVASRLVPPDDPMAPLFGDVATAVVVGRVSEERGITTWCGFTDGRYPNTLGASVPGGTWYDSGRAVLHVMDPAHAYAVFLVAPDQLVDSIHTVLEAAGTSPSAVDFAAIHQGAPWLGPIVREAAQLSRARSVETFREFGYAFGSTLPLMLAQDEPSDDELVLVAGGGVGASFGATLIRWGR